MILSFRLVKILSLCWHMRYRSTCVPSFKEGRSLSRTNMPEEQSEARHRSWLEAENTTMTHHQSPPPLSFSHARVRYITHLTPARTGPPAPQLYWCPAAPNCPLCLPQYCAQPPHSFLTTLVSTYCYTSSISRLRSYALDTSTYRACHNITIIFIIIKLLSCVTFELLSTCHPSVPFLLPRPFGCAYLH